MLDVPPLTARRLDPLDSLQTVPTGNISGCITQLGRQE